MTGNDVIRIRHICKTFDDLKAVRDLSFSVRESACFSILGPNGAGKTTLMGMVYGRTRRDKNKESRVSVFGYDPLHEELKIKYLAGVVPQENNLDEELNVMQNLDIYSRFYQIPKKTARDRIHSLLEFMELQDKKKSRIRELSGGMKRRLIIVRALLNNPRLLILDEPTTGLDPQVRHLIWDKIRQLKKERTTILLTTHYMDEAFQLADKILIMDNGRKILEGEPKVLLKRNIERYVMEVMSREKYNKMKTDLDRKRVRSDEVHEVALLYSNDLAYLKSRASRLTAGDHFIRQTNLEDLFLKTTGRKLNENQ
ncbi:MAG: ABC transporter ATP-binding protein [bacterium]|nr:ABC transporter ATP-binding protein [bacterium]